LHLAASRSFFKRKQIEVPRAFKKLTRAEQRKFLERLEYVDYQPGEPVLRMWMEHHVGSRSIALQVRAQLMDVQGVAGFIRSGLGLGVLPSHLVDRLKKEDEDLMILETAAGLLVNRISVADLSERTASLAAQQLRDFCLKKLK
jgi:DNA-binding transcriptional LysR family regulator